MKRRVSILLKLIKATVLYFLASKVLSVFKIIMSKLASRMTDFETSYDFFGRIRKKREIE